MHGRGDGREEVEKWIEDDGVVESGMEGKGERIGGGRDDEGGG